jgi:hypothetical protein
MEENNISTTAEVKPNKAFIGNADETRAVITEMFFAYVRTDDYASMSKEKRNEFVNVVYELIGLFD